MRLPRDLSGDELIRRLGKPGYTPSRQSGSHVRLTVHDSLGEHHVTISRHDPLRLGTPAAIVGAVAERQGVSRDELLKRLLAQIDQSRQTLYPAASNAFGSNAAFTSMKAPPLTILRLKSSRPRLM